jgi:magnesium-transporting ATPase (P-type)
LRAASDAAIKKAMPAVGAGEGGAVLPVRVLATLAYSQERKRMSVIVQLPVLDADGTPVLAPRSAADEAAARVQGDILLFCKGADSVILERLASGGGGSAEDAEVLQRSKRQMAEWGNDGLRTLCFASRVIPAQAFAEWQQRYVAACADLSEVRRRKAKQANLIDDLMTEVESGLALQGATANEDKLQPEVPETIALLAKGGVKIWMVTGDKQETAVNIGFATRLLDDTMRQVVATAESAGSTAAAMRRLRIAAKRMRAERLEDLARHSASASSFEAAIRWVIKQVEAAEAAMGVSPEAGAHTDIDIDSAELKMEADFDDTGKMRPLHHRIASKASFRRSSSRRSISNVAAGAAGASGVGGGGGSSSSGPPFSSGSVRPASELDGSPLSSKRRERESSFDSDDGETAIAHAGAEVALEAMGHVKVEEAGAAAPNLAPAPAPAFSNPLHPTRSPPSRAAAVKLASKAIAPVLGQQRRPFALVIDEHALDTALAHPRLRAYLLYVAVNCGAVIACRARPDQKASVVRLIRHGVSTSRTLAVGDGANDVDMIGTAHVGVGISGAEGVQAANASDYAIGRFRFLQRLLLVHGRWNYMRMSKLVLYMFWKNIFFVMSQFGFQIVNGYTGQKWYIEFGSQTFNLIYSSVPIIILAVYDRDLDASWVLRYPKLYDFSRLNRGLNVRVFASWYGDAFICAILNTIFTLAYPSTCFVITNDIWWLWWLVNP